MIYSILTIANQSNRFPPAPFFNVKFEVIRLLFTYMYIKMYNYSTYRVRGSL